MIHFFSLSLFIFWSCLEFPCSVDVLELGVGGDRPQASVLMKEAPRELQKVQRLLEKGVVFLVCGGLGPTFSFLFFSLFMYFFTIESSVGQRCRELSSSQPSGYHFPPWPQWVPLLCYVLNSFFLASHFCPLSPRRQLFWRVLVFLCVPVQDLVCKQLAEVVWG